LLSHQQIQDLLGVYALDAVDTAERDAIESHLGGCPSCLVETAGHLRVARALIVDGRPSPLEWPPTPTTATKPRSRRGRLFRGTLATGVVAALALIGWQGVSQQRRLNRVEATVRDINVSAGQTQLLAQAQIAAVDPSARRVTLSDGAGHPVATAIIRANLSGFVLAGAMAPLSPDQTYEMWRVENNRRVPAGLLGSRPQVLAFQLTPDTVIVTITVEAAGGAATSDHPPVAQVAVGP